MYNFLDSKLSPKVSTSTPCTDNYEVENLISENYVIRSRGFVAYSFIKPPVEIVFELICPINIHHIVLTAALDTEKYTTIEVLTKNSNRDFVSIAYARFNSCVVVFCNDRIYSTANPPPNINQSYHLSFFKRNAFRSFTTANTIKVRILKTEGLVPRLGKAEIWGKPSKTCSLTTVNTINYLMQKPVSSNDNSLSDSTTVNDVPALDELEIPDEFKDSLTFEIMALPITLPSGNTVDQSTVEKFAENEASYGRIPSDPFTGQVFTDTRKPVFNDSLKHRIDLFLIQHAHRTETFAIKRTLGKNANADNNENKMNSSKRKAEYTVFNNPKQIKVYDDDDNETVINNKSGDPDEKLNEAIKKITNSKSFVCFTNEVIAIKTDLPSCVKCKVDNNLYVIPCSHLYCKNCLLSIYKELKCTACLKSFCKNDPKKYHL